MLKERSYCSNQLELSAMQLQNFVSETERPQHAASHQLRGKCIGIAKEET